ncbi:hypothetical protein CF319_g273 [Tilletia indica]|nr:hypothetical protein CF319_g273 [Tilletia indica]
MGLSERKVKRRLVGSAVTSNSAWTKNEALPGQRMLASMGWSQGQGLGVGQQGSAAPISVAFKLDNKGLGVTRAEKEARSSGAKTGSMDWLGGGSDYEALLQRINAANAADTDAATPTQTTTEAATSDSDSESDQDDAAAQSQRSDKSKGKKKKEDKKKKKSSKRKDSEDDDAEEGKRKSKSKKEKEDKKKSKRKASEDDDADEAKRRKKSKKEGKRKAADGSESAGEKEVSVTVTTTTTVMSVAPVAPHRLAHRAKFLRAKGLLPSDSRSSPVSGSSTPIILPKSASPSAPASPAPASTPISEPVLEKKPKPEPSVQVEAPTPMITDPLAEPYEPPPSTMSVQTYLANKLIRRKAEIARAKREAQDAVWGRVAAVVATTTTTTTTTKA